MSATIGWESKFAKLDDDGKYMLIKMGIESFMRAWTLHTAGLTTLRGAMSYVPDDSCALADVMLKALNGSNDHRARLAEFMATPMCRNVATTFHPAADIGVGKSPVEERKS